MTAYLPLLRARNGDDTRLQLQSAGEVLVFPTGKLWTVVRNMSPSYTVASKLFFVCVNDGYEADGFAESAKFP